MATHAPVMIARSPGMRRLLADLQRLAPFRHAVMLRGETGTGKELAARTLHAFGPRSTPPFVAVNCGAIPEGLAESELFGHVRGAFTGAHRDHQGAFARACGGTLFLDEVGELPLVVQTKLLRVLESGRCSPVGAEREIEVNVRIVSATHRDLEKMVVSGTLREDLYHRLSVLALEIPPLRRRREDIEGVVEHLCRAIEPEIGRPLALSRDAIAAAERHDWPGNVRALRNAITRAAALADGPITAVELLPDSAHLRRLRSRTPTRPHEVIAIPRGDYRSMPRALLHRVVAREGSIRKAARVLKVPRSTLGTWLKRGVDDVLS